MQLNLQQLKEITKSYFEEQDALEKPYTVVGYARRLGVTRQTLINYENEYCTFVDMSSEEIQEFLDTIKNAKLKIEEQLEEKLITGQATAGIIFNLKNNYGYVDKQEVVSTNNNYNNTNILQNMDKKELLQLVEKLQIGNDSGNNQ